MRYAIISDIHGNREALDAALADISELGVDEIICLGDIVGYGAEPVYCLEKVREVCSVVVAGNHDYAALEKINIDYFNALARQATLWTREQLKDEHRAYLEELPLVVQLESCTVVHGSLDSPEMFDYIQTSYDAYLTMEQLENQVCFIGHSHVPITFLLKDVITYTLDDRVELEGYEKAICNVGSVGQPRDNNPTACYATYDSDEGVVELRRLNYDIDRAAEKILQAGLPEFLAERLKLGR